MSDQFRDQLKRDKKKHGIKTPTPKKKHHRKPEKYTHGEIEDLMGINRPTYKRGPGGAMRQK